MKKLFYYFLFTGLSVALVSSCHEPPSGDYFADTQYVPEGAVVSPQNVVNGFFDLVDLENSLVSFDLIAKGFTPTNVDVTASLNGGVPVSIASSSFPVNISVTASEILTAFGKNANDLAAGDVVTFFFDSTVNGNSYRSSEILKVPFSCSSNLGGTYDYVSTNLKAEFGTPCPEQVTGQVTFEDLGGGKYLCSDLGFGQYGSSCWGDSPATSGDANFIDTCNKISSGGLDQYSLVYIWVITNVDGPNLSISWSNDYGDSGDVVISRPDGTNWPALYTE